MNFLNIKITLLLLFITSIVCSQSNQNYLKTPDALAGYVKSSYMKSIQKEQVSLLTISKNSSTDRNWTVYSDRDNNVLYSQAAGFENGESLLFMEMVVVKEVKESGGATWLHVFSPLIVTESSSRTNVDRGWIKANRVLLSHYALLNEQGIPKKAMALFSIDGMPDGYSPTENSYYYYHSPSISAKKLGPTMTFMIYYILKEEDSWVLLSKTDKLSGSEEESKVIGWMPKSSVTDWDHRLCYEPSTNSAAVEAYKDKPIYVFFTEKDMMGFVETEIVPQLKLRIDRIKPARLGPYTMRMPILSHLNNIDTDKKLVVTIASTGERDIQIEELKKKFQMLYQKSQNVNILFVIDGTQSMTDYYPKIRESILEIINSHAYNENIKLRFGVAIYRDYPDGNEVFDYISLTSNFEKVSNFLRNVVCRSQDKDLPEAVFYGLINGIDKAGFDPSHSNVVVHIGDCGNHEPDPKGYKFDDVIKAVNKYDCSFISFQVINGNDIGYDTFNRDSRKIIYNSAKKYTSSNVKLNEISVNNTYELDYPLMSDEDKSLYMFGRFTYASGYNAMNPEILKTNIVNSISNYLEDVNQQLSIINSILDGPSGKQQISPDLVKWLKNEGFSQEQIDLITQMGEVTKRGYLSKKYYNKDIDCYSPVVFMSIDEKRKIDDQLNYLTKGHLSITERKVAFQDALLQICSRMLGDEPNEAILNKTINEIWQIILAVPYKGDTEIKDLKLKDISANVDDGVFTAFYNTFEEDAKNFINNDFHDSKFKIGDQWFYWIPLEDMP